jgi:phospholipase C
MTPLTRRGLFAGAAGSAALLALEACGSSTTGPPTSTSTPKPTAAPKTKSQGVGGISDPSKAPFDTVVVLMMENRSFDHLLGWLPGVNGKQAGLTYPALKSGTATTAPLGSNTQACGDKDPAHDWPSMATHYNGGKCDGWLKTQVTGDHFPIGYYEQPQVPILGALAGGYTVFDSYHCSLLAATWPNRFYQLCAATDVDLTGFFPATGKPRPSNLELAIFDRLKAANLTAGYYTWGEPMTELFASKKYDAITHPKADFFTAAAAGKLPNVTFIDPDYTTVSEFLGTSNDYHPHGDIEAGESYLADVYNALRTSPQWGRMVFVLNFDENGGFYDHVPPPTVVDDNVNPNKGPHPDYKRLGFRVPAIAMGPFAPRKVESAGPYEHCSILRMIEWRWGLAPMTARDAHAKNLAEALDFTTTREAITLPAFTPFTSKACPNPQVALA